jgi:hypothetical protein
MVTGMKNKLLLLGTLAITLTGCGSLMNQPIESVSTSWTSTADDDTTYDAATTCGAQIFDRPFTNGTLYAYESEKYHKFILNSGIATDMLEFEDVYGDVVITFQVKNNFAKLSATNARLIYSGSWYNEAAPFQLEDIYNSLNAQFNSFKECITSELAK